MGKESTKMKKFITALLLITTLSAGVVVQPAMAGKCGNVETSVNFNCKTSDKAGENTITALLLTVINFMAIGVGIAVVGGIVWGSLWYITANGNASQAQQGITIIFNSVAGLVLFIFMWALVNFLVPGGVFK